MAGKKDYDATKDLQQQLQGRTQLRGGSIFLAQ
jgi:hypothetical protein